MLNALTFAFCPHLSGSPLPRPCPVSLLLSLLSDVSNFCWNSWSHVHSTVSSSALHTSLHLDCTGHCGTPSVGRDCPLSARYGAAQRATSCAVRRSTHTCNAQDHPPHRRYTDHLAGRSATLHVALGTDMRARAQIEAHVSRSPSSQIALAAAPRAARVDAKARSIPEMRRQASTSGPLAAAAAAAALLRGVASALSSLRN